MPSWLNLNNILKAVATVVGVAGAVVAAPAAVVPAAVAGMALKVVTYGTVVGIIAAKVLPGHGQNAPDAIKPSPKP